MFGNSEGEPSHADSPGRARAVWVEGNSSPPTAGVLGAEKSQDRFGYFKYQN